MIECSAWGNCSEDCANYTFYHNYWPRVDRLLRYDETSDSVHHLCKHTQPGTSTLHDHALFTGAGTRGSRGSTDPYNFYTRFLTLYNFRHNFDVSFG